MHPIESAFRSAWQVKDNRTIIEWLSDNVRFGANSSFQGPFNIDNVPWTRRIYELWQDPGTRYVSISGAPQYSGKTVVAQCCMAWQVANDPAPMGYYAEIDSKAKRFADTRWRPMIDACPAVRHHILSDTKQRTIFKDGSFLVILGAESDANRQSDSLRVVVKDEAWHYKSNWNKEIDDRTGSFEVTKDWKILSLGYGGMVGHDFVSNYNEGSQEVWEVPCPHCGGYHDYKWDRDNGGVFRWEKKFDADGSTLLVNETLNTLHIECPHCGGKIWYNEGERKKANESGRWRVTNRDAKPGHYSFRIPRFVNPSADWRDIVRMWLRISDGQGVGKRDALKDFIMKELAEQWEDRPLVKRSDLPKGNYTRQQMLNGEWEDELTLPGGHRARIATVDYQHGAKGEGEHMWFVVRAFSATGESRLVDCGKVYDWNDLNERLIECGVPPAFGGNPMGATVFVDCAWKQDVVFEKCAKFGWLGVRGEDTTDRRYNGMYLHTIRRKSGRSTKVLRHYSELNRGQLGIGVKSAFRGYAPWRRLNNHGLENILYELRSGANAQWTVPEDIDEFCPDYAVHMSNKIFVNIAKDGAKPEYRWQLAGRAETHPDHLYDCEKYAAGGALILRLMHSVADSETIPDDQ